MGRIGNLEGLDRQEEWDGMLQNGIIVNHRPSRLFRDQKGCEADDASLVNE
jgi:hypothetical protein